MQPRDTLHLDVHGTHARVLCQDAETLAKVADDFSLFRAAEDGAAGIELILHRDAPRYDDLPPLKAGVHTPRNICYTSGHVTYIDYGGKALAVYDRRAQRIEVWSDRPHLLHEIAYLTLLSRLGEGLERRGLHRVHALAVGDGERSAIVLLPSTGGKTTLALHFLRRGGDLRLVSEDSPLVDRRGLVYPFPLRLGILADEPPDFPPEFVSYAERMEFAPKYLVSLRAFPGAVSMGVTKPSLLLIGRRTLGRDCVIRPVGRLTGLRALARDMIVGVGLYQGVEFLLTGSAAEVVGTIRLGLGRLRSALALLTRVRVFEIELGRNVNANAETLAAFFHAQGLGVAKARLTPARCETVG